MLQPSTQKLGGTTAQLQQLGVACNSFLGVNALQIYCVLFLYAFKLHIQVYIALCSQKNQLHIHIENTYMHLMNFLHAYFCICAPIYVYICVYKCLFACILVQFCITHFRVQCVKVGNRLQHLLLHLYVQKAVNRWVWTSLACGACYSYVKCAMGQQQGMWYMDIGSLRGVAKYCIEYRQAWLSKQRDLSIVVIA